MKYEYKIWFNIFAWTMAAIVVGVYTLDIFKAFLIFILGNIASFIEVIGSTYLKNSNEK